MDKPILTNEELEEKKREARLSEIRQNVKSHCTKIRDGIQKNGTNSTHRAIWELFQNAGDLSDHAEIDMTINDNSFIFSHKGKPFTYDTLCSLVKQVSSEDKEDDKPVGQYGTGFLTTHTFGLNIILEGSMCISKDPDAYVDINDFEIKRENFKEIPKFIEDMTHQIDAVNTLMDSPQHEQAREWTKLKYLLDEERLHKVQSAIDEAIQLMPYVLTFNDNIKSCHITDNTRNFSFTFAKEEIKTNIEELNQTRVWIDQNNSTRSLCDCYYLQLHEGKSRIILPLDNENTVKEFKNTPHLYIHFPLIGEESFNVNFLFHSHNFRPEEARDNIIIPKNNSEIKDLAEQNVKILDEMTQYLWDFLEKHIEQWNNTIKMASLPIKTTNYKETETEEFYRNLKKRWVDEFMKLKLIDIKGVKHAMNEEKPPQMLEEDLVDFLSEEQNKKFVPTLYKYAENVATIPKNYEFLEWSRIINEWNVENDSVFLKLETIVENISDNQDENLHDILEMLVDSGHEGFFTNYALLPNRDNTLKKRHELRDAESITEDLYNLVYTLDKDICEKFIDFKFADIVNLPKYNRANLRDEINSSVNAEKNRVRWNDNNLLSDEYYGHLLKLCSAFTTQNGTSKRNKLMPIICGFEGIEYQQTYIPAWKDDDKSLDIYRQAFITVVENQMRKISGKDHEWVTSNLASLAEFIDNARGDDFRNFCTQYAIYPDCELNLHLPNELKKAIELPDILFEWYENVIHKNLHEKCVHHDFENYFDDYTKPEYQFSAQSVANEIQNQLSIDKYDNVIVLDIIEATEKKGEAGETWQKLFKDIYNQRQSIRYNMGSPDERTAINTMLKQKNPELLMQMARVSEKKNANMILRLLDKAIEDSEQEIYLKMLGDFVENHIQKFIQESLAPIGVSVRNEQGGQDLILSKTGHQDYFIEIKSRWVDKESAIMSSMQFQTAVANPESYALISAQMWTFDRQRVINKENVPLEEFYDRIKILECIGSLESDLKNRIENAFKGEDDEIKAVGSYAIHIPQEIFSQHPCDFNQFMENLKMRFR